MSRRFRDWQRTLGAPEDPTATDSTSEWSAMSLLKALYDKLQNGLTITSILTFKGGFDASAGIFPGGGLAEVGWFYKATVTGTVDGIPFGIGDSLYAVANNASETVYAGSWLKIEGELSLAEIEAVIGFTFGDLAAQDTITASQISNASANGRSLIMATDYAAMAVLLGIGDAPVNTSSLLSVLSDAEIADVLAGTNAIDITAKINAWVSAAAQGATLDATMLIGVVTLTAPLFNGIATAPVTFKTGRVNLKMNFNGSGGIQLPSFLTWDKHHTKVSPTVKIESIGGDGSPSMVHTFVGGVGRTCSGTGGQSTIEISDASDIHIGTRIAILGVFANPEFTGITLINNETAGSTAVEVAGISAAQIGVMYGSFLVGTEILRGVYDSGVIDTTQSIGGAADPGGRGVFGTTAAAHSAGAAVTILQSQLVTVTDVDGTTLTLNLPLQRSFVGAPLRFGAVNARLTGIGEIDGEMDRGDPASIPFVCFTSALGQGIKSDGLLRLRGAPTGGVMLRGCKDCDLNFDLIDFTGIPATLKGSAVWFFGTNYDCTIRVRHSNNGYEACLFDNKSDSITYYGTEQPNLRCRYEADEITDHSIGVDITASSDCVAIIGHSDCDNFAVGIFDNDFGGTFAIAALRNYVRVETQAVYRAPAGDSLPGNIIHDELSAGGVTDAELLAIGGLTSAADRLPYFTGLGTAALATFTSVARTLVAQTTQALMRSAGLGSTAVGDAVFVAANAAAARTAIGAAIGTDVQAFAANLAAWAGLTSAANKLGYFTGAGTAAVADFTAVARTLVAQTTQALMRTAGLGSTAVGDAVFVAANAAAARTAIGAVIGTDVQAFAANLAAWAGLTSAADKLGYFTGAGTAAVADFTAVARTLVAQTTQALMRTAGLGSTAVGDAVFVAANAAAARTAIGTVIGTDVQAFAANLAAWAGLTSAAEKLGYWTGAGTAGVVDFTSAGWVPSTPTPTPGGGAFTATSAIRTFSLGKKRVVSGRISITNVGTGTGSIRLPLGFTPAGKGSAAVINPAGSAKALVSFVANGDSGMYILNFDATSPIAVGDFDFTLCAEST